MFSLLQTRLKKVFESFFSVILRRTFFEACAFEQKFVFYNLPSATRQGRKAKDALPPFTFHPLSPVLGVIG